MPKKVLVVDDEPSITDLVSLILTEKGYEVSIANDGKQGLKQFESVEKDIPIIVISGHTVGAQFLKTARIFGAGSSLRKPFTSQQLINAIKKCLET